MWLILLITLAVFARIIAGAIDSARIQDEQFHAFWRRETEKWRNGEN